MLKVVRENESKVVNYTEEYNNIMEKYSDVIEDIPLSAYKFDPEQISAFGNTLNEFMTKNNIRCSNGFVCIVTHNEN